MELNSHILTNNPKILEFFKEKEQDEIDNILLSFIQILEKHGVSSNSTNSSTIHDNEENKTCEITTSKYENTDNITINRYELKEINKEYVDFYKNKDNLIGILKEIEKQALQFIDNMRMPFLEKYISESCDKELSYKLQTMNQYKCNLCNYYTCITKKALSAHQRGCKKYIGSL